MADARKMSRKALKSPAEDAGRQQQGVAAKESPAGYAGCDDVDKK